MKLTIQKKPDQDRNCLIKLDDSVWGTLSERVLRTLFHYQTGVFEISDAEADAIRSELLNTARKKLLDWLARQERCSQESNTFLKKQQFHSSIVSTCLDEAKNRHYIDDARYCRILIESLVERKKSPLQIKSKLIEKRLPASLWEPLLTELYDNREQTANLKEQAEKAFKRYRNLEQRIAYQKCLTALYRLGFDIDDARGVLADLFDSGQ